MNTRTKVILFGSMLCLLILFATVFSSMKNGAYLTLLFAYPVSLFMMFVFGYSVGRMMKE